VLGATATSTFISLRGAPSSFQVMEALEQLLERRSSALDTRLERSLGVLTKFSSRVSIFIHSSRYQDE